MNILKNIYPALQGKGYWMIVDYKIIKQMVVDEIIIIKQIVVD